MSPCLTINFPCHFYLLCHFTLLKDVTLHYYEKDVAYAVSQYLQFKKLMYRFDLAADIRLTIGQAARNKKLQGDSRGYPDLVVLEPRGQYHALFVELKKDKSEVYKKNGDFKKSDHLSRQIEYHKRLRKRGYCAVFGLGTHDAIEKIEKYLKGEL